MNALIWACVFMGGVMLVVSLARLLPEIGLDSPLELLASLVGWNRETGLFHLVQQHLRESWPHTKVLAVLFHGGWILLTVPLLVFVVIPGLLKELGL